MTHCLDVSGQDEVIIQKCKRISVNLADSGPCFCTACHLQVLIGLRTTLILTVNQGYSIIKRTKETCLPVMIFSARYREIHEKNETDVCLIDSNI